MKKYFYMIAALFVAVFSTSCLDSNLEDLEVYSDCEIQSGEAFWRWIDTNETIPGSGENKVKQVQLQRGSQQFWDELENTLKIRYVTGRIPAEEIDNFTEEKMVVVVTISTAATIKPIGDAPEFGKPGDWRKNHQYEVTAADGTKKTWTIIVEDYYNPVEY